MRMLGKPAANREQRIEMEAVTAKEKRSEWIRGNRRWQQVARWSFDGDGGDGSCKLKLSTRLVVSDRGLSKSERQVNLGIWIPTGGSCDYELL